AVANGWQPRAATTLRQDGKSSGAALEVRDHRRRPSFNRPSVIPTWSHKVGEVPRDHVDEPVRDLYVRFLHLICLDLSYLICCTHPASGYIDGIVCGVLELPPLAVSFDHPRRDRAQQLLDCLCFLCQREHALFASHIG